MIEYIQELLYRYDCVIIPEFGAFLAQRIPAKLPEGDEMFYPPKKQLSFNQQIKNNDGLLANYIATKENISYEAANLNVQDFVKKLHNELNEKARFTFEDVGVFTLNLEKNLVFEPLHTTNFLTEAFGLGKVKTSAVLRETLKEEVEEIEKVIPIAFTPEKRETFITVVKYAAACIAVFGLLGIIKLNPYKKYVELKNREAINEGKILYNEETQKASFSIDLPDTLSPLKFPSILTDEEKELIKEIESKKEAEKQLASEASFENKEEKKDTLIEISKTEEAPIQIETENNNKIVDVIPVEEVNSEKKIISSSINKDTSKTTSAEVPTKKNSVKTPTKEESKKTTVAVNTEVYEPNLSPNKKYHIIAGAFKDFGNANKKMDQLKAQGFKPVYVGQNRFGLHQVAFSSFETRKAANIVLIDIKKKYNKGAWLLVK